MSDSSGMAAAQRFLSMKVGQVERPKPLPIGLYVLDIQKIEITESSQKKTPGAKITFSVAGHHESLDPAQLEGIKWMGKEMSDTFWLTENSLYRLTGDLKAGTEGFFQIAGVFVDSDTGIMEALQQLKGRRVLADVGLRPNQEGDGFFNEIKGYKKLAA